MSNGNHSTLSQTRESHESAVNRAIRAWTRLSLNEEVPAQAEILKPPRSRGKSLVIGLGRVGPGGMHVVAKELLVGAARVELALYQDILPRLSVGAPKLIGWTESVDSKRLWLFLEAAVGEQFDRKNQVHRAAASRSLAALHVETACLDLPPTVPRRNLAFYERELIQAASDLDNVVANQALDESDRLVLQSVIRSLYIVLSEWARVAESCAASPVGLAHGDYKRDNMAFTDSRTGGDLRIFDWSEAHWGPIAVDLWEVDADLYHDALVECGFSPKRLTVESWVRLGRLLYSIRAVAWEIPRLSLDWVGRSMKRMALYERSLRGLVEDLVP
jgi:hypothetical protein